MQKLCQFGEGNVHHKEILYQQLYRFATCIEHVENVNLVSNIVDLCV